MSDILESAKSFMDSCDSGKGWETCSEYCHADATFRVQAPALGGIDTVEAYTEWAKSLLTPMPDARYELKCIAEDKERSCVVGFGLFHGTHTEAGGPVEATGKSASTDYVYVMHFEDGRIKSMEKIWNDSFALQQLGWA